MSFLFWAHEGSNSFPTQATRDKNGIKPKSTIGVNMPTRYVFRTSLNVDN